MRHADHVTPSVTRGRDTARLLFVVDIAGTLLFGIEGATAAHRAGLDALGLMVLAFSTALGGGIIRDLLIGAAPPAALRDWRYPIAAFTGGLVVFLLNRWVAVIPASAITVLDAAALGLFAVAGAEKALVYKLHPFIAILMGGVTGVGGGTVRDMLLGQVPLVLRAEVYATAALAGAACLIVALKLGLSPIRAAFVGGTACFLLRVVSVWQQWNLPGGMN